MDTSRGNPAFKTIIATTTIPIARFEYGMNTTEFDADGMTLIAAKEAQFGFTKGENIELVPRDCELEFYLNGDQVGLTRC